MLSIKQLKPQLVLNVSDEELGLLGYVVIDRIIFNKAIGGVRIRKGLSIDEVANLAREMTLKFVFLNLPVGGAKAAVIWKAFSSDEERKKTFTSFGRNLGPLLTKEIFIAGQDMGTSALDLYHIHKGAGRDIERPGSNNGISGYYTALTVFISAEKLADSLGLKLADARVAIEGLGKVGMVAAKLFSDAGADIVGVSTIRGCIYNPEGLDIDKLIELQREAGDEAVNLYPDAETIPKESLLALDVDILVPCAGPDTITKDNVWKLKAKMVISGANIAATAEGESLMSERGIHSLPGYVSNSGGILYYALREHGFRGTDVARIMKRGFGNKISHLIKISKKERVSLNHMAGKIAKRNLNRLEQATGPKRKEKLLVLLNRWQSDGLRAILWRCHKMSFKFRASFLLKSFAIKYIEDFLSNEAPSWTDL